MMRSELLHQLWINYCGEDTFAVTIPSHIFSVVELANKTFLKLEGIPKPFDLKSQKYGYIYGFGKHSRLYQAALFADKLSELKKMGKIDQVILLYREIIRLSPNNPAYKDDFAILLAKDPNQHQEAELLYREAIRLSPNNLNFRHNYTFGSPGSLSILI